MHPLVRLITPVLAVNLPEFRHVIAAPPAEEHEVVEPLGVLVETHEGEEAVEDLVVDLEPRVSLGFFGEGAVEHTGHDHEEDGSGDGDYEDPEEEGHVDGVSDPLFPHGGEGGPVDFPVEDAADSLPDARGFDGAGDLVSLLGEFHELGGGGREDGGGPGFGFVAIGGDESSPGG